MDFGFKSMLVRLNSDNYFTWKYKMEMYLRKEKCWSAVSPGERPVVPDLAAGGANQAAVTAAETALATFVEKNEQALALIGLCVEDGQLVHIRTKQTAKEAWDSLRGYHERNTLCNKVTLMRKICGLKLTEKGNVETHLSELTNSFQKLVDLGENQLDEHWKVAITLSSLPSSYDSLVEALEARPDADLTLSLVHSKLIERAKRQENNGNSSSNEHNGDTVLKTAERKLNVICFFCKKGGHVKKDCVKHKEWLKKKPKEKTKGDKVNSVEESNDALFTVSTTDDSNSSGCEWLIDSGATSHVVNNRHLFMKFDSHHKSQVDVANGGTESVCGKGTCSIEILNESGNVAQLKLSNVLFAPQITGNMLSVGKLCADGFTVCFGDSSCTILHNGKQIGIADEVNGLYKLRQPNKVCSLKSNEYCIHDWHRIFGHRDPNAIKAMNKSGMLDGMKMVDCGKSLQCETCMKAKTTRLPFPKKALKKSNKVLELIHTDVCGPMQVESFGKKKWLLTIIDDFSRYTVIYFLRNKSDVGESVKEYIAMVENKFGCKPKTIRSDRGGEYMAGELKQFFRTKGIATQYTAPYSPQQNGVAERKNRTLIEMARCMLTDAHLPYYLWAEAVSMANYIQNRTITKGADEIPHILWYGTKPSVVNWQIFGTKCYVHVPSEKRRKLDNTATQMIFIGYDSESKAYRCFDPVNRKLVISRDVRFVRNKTHEDGVLVDLSSKEEEEANDIDDESSLFDGERSFDSAENSSYKESSDSADDADGDVTITNHSFYRDSDTSSESSTTDDSESSVETVIPANFEATLDDEYGDLTDSFGDLSMTDTEATADTSGSEYLPSNLDSDETETEHSPRVSQRRTKGVPPQRYQANMIVEPKSISDAFLSENKIQWIDAMKEEMQAMQSNNTWELCELPDGRNAIGCKWIFKAKTDANGNVNRYKARLVAQGFSQKFGTDYDQVFAPVARQTTFRILLSVASKENCMVHHMDVKTAFLNSKLKEEIYMKQPPGFESEKKNLVCRLKKSIYGLKQAAKAWNDEIRRVLTQEKFTQSKNDVCLYSKKVHGEWVFLLIYVDDIAIVTKSDAAMKNVKAMLSSKFKVQDLGEVKQYLSIEVTRDSNGIYSLNQSKYIKKIVSDFGLSDAKASSIPIQVGYGKSKRDNNDDLLLSNVQYQKLLGCLLYVSVNTRPDIAASISILAQKISKPTQADWNELKRVAKYLKGTADLKLTLAQRNFSGEILIGYSDANWADNKNDRKSQSGHCFIVNGATVCWSSRKQPLVALSTCESEFIALSEACRAAAWIRRILIDLKQSVSGATTIFEDNQSCLKLIEEEERLSDRSKHIDTRFHFVKDYISKGIVHCTYCPTENMLADVLTKPIAATKFEAFRKQFLLK